MWLLGSSNHKGILKHTSIQYAYVSFLIKMSPWFVNDRVSGIEGHRGASRGTPHPAPAMEIGRVGRRIFTADMAWLGTDTYDTQSWDT